MRKFNRSFMVVALLIISTSAAYADIPRLITFQGRLTDDSSAPVADGTYDLIFTLYPDSIPGPSGPFWQETQSVHVIDGLFDVRLGQVEALPPEVFNGSPMFLGMIGVAGTEEFAPRIRLTSAAFAFRSLHADTADFVQGGSGWVDDGAVVRLETATDRVGIGTSTPNEHLVVGNDMGSMYGEFIVASDPAIDGTSGFTAGYDIDNRGWFSWDNEEKEFQIGARSNGTTSSYNIYLANGNVGIGNSWPSEPLSVGGSLGSWTGNMMTIGDNQSTGSAGLIFGQNSLNYGYLAYDNVGKYLLMRSMADGIYQGYQFVLKDRKVGINTIPPDTATMTVNDSYNELTLLEEATGIASKVTNSTTDGIIHGGHFYADGGRQAIGIRVEAYNGYQSETGCVVRSDHMGLDVNAPIAADMTGLVFLRNDTFIYGNLSKTSGSFRIDHPLDPANKYLQHSFVESPDMMNVYNGNVVTDADGEAVVTLPDYFETLNKDFRYQLTVIGEFAQAIVKEEIKDNTFSIMTDRPNIKVSWQVTGVRQDPWANEHRIQVEIDKDKDEIGYYVAPELYGLGEDREIGRSPSDNVK